MWFFGLSPLVIEDVTDEGERIVVRARTPQDAAVRPVRPTSGCCPTFREQAPGVLECHQRRTARLTRKANAVVKESAGRAGAPLPARPAVGLSRHTALRTLLRIPLPAGRVPRVIGVGDFALRRRHRCATVVIDAEAVRGALPHAVQVADRRHVWHNLCEAALSEVKAHSTCWAAVLDAALYGGPRAQTTPERRPHVHDLLDQGAGLLECARRLRSARNTVERYARADRPERTLRVPEYRAGLVDPCREHLRKRRAEDPAPSSASSKSSRPSASRAASTAEGFCRAPHRSGPDGRTAHHRLGQGVPGTPSTSLRAPC